MESRQHVAARNLTVHGIFKKGAESTMSRSAFILSLLASGLIAPLSCAQGTLTFNIGGGISTPLNPTGQYSGTSGNLTAGSSYSINKRSSIVGEFLWSGLPPNIFVLHPIEAPFGNINLYTLTADYRYAIDRIHGSRFGVYGIGGGGWYYRYASVDKNFVLPPNTVCQPIYTWWGYACSPGGTVFTQTIAYKGASVGGANGGVGFTMSFGILRGSSTRRRGTITHSIPQYPLRSYLSLWESG
jgi:Outer membrane protein beta-barrel domain